MTINNEQLPKVAVLLAAYNGMKWIEEQLNSILNQQGVSVTIFASVDFSTDGTEQWLSEFSSKHNNVVLLPYGERYGGAGPNFFRLVRDVDLSGFDAVSFADQDDIWYADKLRRACDLIQAGNCDVYSSNVIAFWPDGKQVLIDKAQPQKKYDYFFEAAGPGCTYVFSTVAALALQSLVIDYSDQVKNVTLHDWLAYAFCRHRGFKWFIDPKPSMLYRQHAGNQVGTNTGFKAFKKRLEMASTHWYRNQHSLIVELVAPEKKLTFSSLKFRVFNFYSLRRRTRDAFALLAMFLFGVY